MGDNDPGTARHISGMFGDIMSYLKIENAGQLVVTASAKGDAAEKRRSLWRKRKDSTTSGRRLNDGLSGQIIVTARRCVCPQTVLSMFILGRIGIT